MGSTFSVFNIVISGVGGQGTVLAAKLLAQCALASGAFVRSAETIGMAQRGGSVLGHVRILESSTPKRQLENIRSPHDESESALERSQGSVCVPGSEQRSVRVPGSKQESVCMPDGEQKSVCVPGSEQESSRASDCAASSSRLLASPLVPPAQAQLLIGFEPAETLRASSFCNPGSLVVTATRPLAPPTASLQRLEYDGSAQLVALAQAVNKEHIARLIPVNNDVVSAELGFDKALNVVLLGAALAALEAGSNQLGNGQGEKDLGRQYSGSGCTALTYAAMQDTIKNTVKQRFVETNLRALEIGYTTSWK